MHMSDDGPLAVGSATMQARRHASCCWIPMHTHLGEVHEPGSITLDLLVRGHSAKGDLTKTLLMESAVCDPTHDCVVPFDQSDRPEVTSIDECQSRGQTKLLKRP